MNIPLCIKFHSKEEENKLYARFIHGSQDQAGIVLAEWRALLGTSAGEQQIQDFLELHPELLPGLFDLHNGPLHGIIVTKFPFGADYKCDFAFVTRHSAAMQFTFVEIEDPHKPVFNRDGSFSQAFNHARQQLADWKLWAEKNINTLMTMFGSMFETYNADNDRKDFRFYLVCGRRSEVESDLKRKERWSGIHALDGNKIIVMSYDRLNSFEKVNDKLVVCTYQERCFYAKGSVI